jgi:lipoate-protein ligase B
MNVTPGAYLATLEQALTLACAAGGVSVRIRNCRAIARTGEVGQIGTLVKSGVTQFGLSINVHPNLDVMRYCETGISGQRFSSLAADRMNHISMSTIRESLARHLSELFQFETRHWYTGHPMLTRTKKKVYVHS